MYSYRVGDLSVKPSSCVYHLGEKCTAAVCKWLSHVRIYRRVYGMYIYRYGTHCYAYALGVYTCALPSSMSLPVYECSIKTMYFYCYRAQHVYVVLCHQWVYYSVYTYTIHIILYCQNYSLNW